jgi:hypothetical protein
VLIRSDLTDPEEVMDVTLSELNDGHDYTFEQIADLVEEQL